MEWNIGNVKIKNQVVFAPMAGVGNSAYRKIIKEMGCGLIFAEMVSDKAIVFDNKKTMDMLYMEDVERPIVQQIFGSDVDSFTEAAKVIYKTMNPDIIDINMGCPVPKVAQRAQAGAALLKDENKIYEIVSAVVNAVDCPVTVKIRSGWDESNINAVSVAKVIEKAGASAITVHPRTRKQGYSGNADWSIIKAVKDAVSIPVIGNGDIKDIYLAKKMLEETNADAIMIGRGLLGNPWLVNEVISYIEKEIILYKPSMLDRVLMIEKHFSYLTKVKNEKVAILEIRTHIGWYLKPMKKYNDYKIRFFKTKTTQEVESLINELITKVREDEIEKNNY